MTVTISEATWNELLDEARAALGRLDELAAEKPQAAAFAQLSAVMGVIL